MARKAVDGVLGGLLDLVEELPAAEGLAEGLGDLKLGEEPPVVDVKDRKTMQERCDVVAVAAAAAGEDMVVVDDVGQLAWASASGNLEGARRGNWSFGYCSSCVVAVAVVEDVVAVVVVAAAAVTCDSHPSFEGGRWGAFQGVGTASCLSGAFVRTLPADASAFAVAVVGPSS